MKSEPVFSVVSRSTSAGWARSCDCVAAVGSGAVLLVGSGVCACEAFGAAIEAPPAATTPVRNLRRCRPSSDLAIGVTPVFRRAGLTASYCRGRLAHRKRPSEDAARGPLAGLCCYCGGTCRAEGTYLAAPKRLSNEFAETIG